MLFIYNANLGLYGSTSTSKQSLLNNSKFNHVGHQSTHPSYSSQQPPQQLQHSRMQSHFAQQQQPQPPQPQPNSNTQQSSDDDLGFDPFFETQKGLAELLENEMIQLNHRLTCLLLLYFKHTHIYMFMVYFFISKLLDNCQRTRMPPPGFNHMNAFGFGVPRAQGSKILPFMNAANNGVLPQQQQQPQHQQQSQQHPMQPTVGPNNGWAQQQLQQQQSMQQQNMGFDQTANGHLHQSNKSGKSHV